jgi:hypothetical protein
MHLQKMAAQVRLRSYTLFWPIVPELCSILAWTYYAAYFSGIIFSCLSVLECDYHLTHRTTHLLTVSAAQSPVSLLQSVLVSRSL